MYLDWQNYSIRKIANGYGLKSNTYIQCNVWWSQDSLQAPILLLHHRMDAGNHYWSGLAIVIPTCFTEQKLKCSSMRSAQHTMGVWRSTLLQAFSTHFQCTAQKCDFRNVGSRTQHAIKMGNVWTIYYPSCFWVLFSVTLVTLRPYCFVCFVLLGGSGTVWKVQIMGGDTIITRQLESALKSQHPLFQYTFCLTSSFSPLRSYWK